MAQFMVNHSLTEITAYQAADSSLQVFAITKLQLVQALHTNIETVSMFKLGQCSCNEDNHGSI